MQKAFYPALLLILCLWPACSLLGDDDLSDFQQQRSQWERQGLSNYAYTLNVACFCPYLGPVRVDVRADSVYRAMLVDTGLEIADPDSFNIKTIDGLFEVLERALKEADEVEVDYDAQYGFPTLISIDYYKDAVDDEISYRATDLQVPGVD
jgi:hypothetical protein